MMNQKDFAIGILTTTAVILFTGLIIISAGSDPAHASGMTASAGPYLLTVGTISPNDEELLYVTNTLKRKMAIYRFDGGKRTIELIDGIELDKLADPAQTPASGKPKKP